VRSLFGLPVIRTASIELSSKEKIEGDLWIYYPIGKATTPENPPVPVDSNDAEKLSGAVPCFIVQFDSRGRATWQKASVMHPIQSQLFVAPKK